MIVAFGRFRPAFREPDHIMFGARCILSLYVATVLAATGLRADVAATGAASDSVYSAHHPSILFTIDELPGLRAKVVDGGRDDDAYALIRTLAQTSYLYWSPASILAQEYGIVTIPNLGLVAWIEQPYDSVVAAPGRTATVYLANNYGPDYSEHNTGMRFRSLVLGYDLFFTDATEEERQIVLDELIEYTSFVTYQSLYELFAHRPYLSNHSAMFAGPTRRRQGDSPRVGSATDP